MSPRRPPRSEPPDRSEALGRLAEEVRSILARGEPLDAGALAARHGVLPDDVARVVAAASLLAGAGAAEPEEPPLPPPRLPDDYEVLGELGRGGMGVVYRARQKSLGRVVAVKVLRPGDLVFGQLLRRFQQEAQALARLRHPHIVSVHEVGEVDGAVFFTMDLVEGGTLADEIRAGRITPSRAVRVLRQVTSAISYTHGAGLVHRDLKPGNILLDEGGTAYVVDFGLARDRASDAGLTSVGQIVGTPAYMSPEQARGDSKAIGEATDVYAIGAILYECLVGQPPFEGLAPVEMLHAILHRDPVRPRKLDPKVPPDLEAVCLKALEKDPAKRYATARALLEDLERFEEGKPVRAMPISNAERMVRTLRRRWRPVAAAVAAAVLVGGGVWWSLAPRLGETPATLVGMAIDFESQGNPGAAAAVYERVVRQQGWSRLPDGEAERENAREVHLGLLRAREAVADAALSLGKRADALRALRAAQTEIAAALGDALPWLERADLLWRIGALEHAEGATKPSEATYASLGGLVAGKPWGTHEEERLALLARLGPIAAPSDAARDVLRAIMGATPPAPPAESGGPSDAEATRRRQPLIASAWERLASITDAEVARVVARVADGHAALTDDERDDVEIVALTRAKDLERSLAAAAETARAPLGQARACEALCRVADLPFFTESCATPGGRARILAFWREVEGLPRQERYRRCVAEAYAKNDLNTGEPGSQDLAAWLTQHTAFAVEASPIGPRVAAWRDWRSEWLRRKADDPTSWLLVGIVHAHPGALPSRTELLTRFEASERDERPWLHFLLWLTTPEGEEAPGRGLRWSSWTASRGRAEPLHLDVAWHRRILGADAPPTHQVRVAALSFASDARTVDVLWEQVKPLRFGDHARIHRVTRLEPLASAGPSLGAPPRLPGRAETVGVAPGAGPGALDLDVGVTPAFSGGRMGLAFTQAEARAIGGAHVGFALPYGGRVRAGHVAPLGGALGARSVLVVATLEPIDPAAGPYLVSRWSEALSAQLKDLVRDAEAVRVSARTWRGTGLADEAQADLEESTRCAAIVAALLPDPRWSEAVEQLARSVSLGEDRTRTGDPALQALHLARLAHLASWGEAIELQPGAYFTPFQRALGGALRTEDGSQAGSAPELYALRLALAARSAIVRRQALDALRPLLTDVRGSWARPIVRAHFARSGDALPLWLPVGAGGGSSSPHRPLLALAAAATMALALGWSRPRVRRGAAGCLVGAGVALLATCDGSADAHRVGSLAVLAGLSVLFASLPGTRLRWLAVPSAVGFFGATIAAWVPAAEMRRVEVLDAMLRLACAAVPCVAIAMHAAARRPSPSGRAAVDLRRARPRLSIAEIPWLLLAGLFAFVYAVGGHEGWDRGRAVGLAVALAFVLGSATRRWQTDREEEPGRFHRGLARASAWTGAHRKFAAGCAAGLLLLVALLSTWPPSGLPNPTKAPEVRIGEARSLETAGRDEEAVAAYENALGAVGWTLEAVERGSILEPSSSEREAVAGLVRTRASWATALADAGDLEGARRTARVAVLAATRLGFDRGAADPATRDGIDRARFVMALARARGGTGGDVLDALELPRARDPDVDDDTLTAWRDRWPHVAPLLRVPLLDTAAPLHADASALFLRLVVEEPNLDRPDARLARWLAGERDAGLPVLRELVAAPLAEGEDARSWWRAIERVAGAVGVTCGERAVDVCAEVARDAKAPEGTRARAAELLCRLGDLPLTFVPAETRREAGVPQVPVEDFARRADALALWAEVRSLSRLAGFRRRLERAFADASDDSIGFQWIQCHTGDFGTTGPLWRAWWGRNRARDPRAWLGPETLPAEKDLASLPVAELLAKVFPAGGEPPTSPARRARAHQLLLLAAPQDARVPVSATPFGLLDDTFLDEPDDLCRAWHEALGADGRMPTFRLVVAETVRETPFAPLAIGWYSEWTLHAGGTLAVELPADPAAKPPIEPVPPARAGDIGPPPAWWRECVLPGLLHVSDAWFRRPNDVRRADPDRTWRPEVGVDVRTLGASVGWTPATGWCLRSHGFGDAGDPRRGARNRLRPDRCGAIRVRGPFLQTLLLPEQPLVPGDLASWRGVVARALGQATSDVRTIGGHEDPRDRPGAILGLMPLLAAATVRGDELAGGAARLDLEIQRQASAGRMPDLDRARLLAALAFGTATSDAMRDAEAKLDAVTWIRAAGATASANARAAAWKRALSAGLDVPTAIAIDAARRAGQVEVPADLQAQVEFARTGPHRMLFGMHSEEPRSPPWDVAAVLLVGAFALGVAWRRRRRAVDPTRPAAIALLLGLAAAASRVRLGTSILPNLELGLAISAGAAALGGRSGGVVPRIAPATLGIGVALLLASRLLPPFDGLDVAGTAMVALGVSTLAWLRVPRAGTQGLSRPERAEGATRAFLLALGLAMTFGYLLVARPGTFPDGEGRAAAPGMPAWLVVGAGISLLTLWATAGNRAPPSRARRRHPPPKPPPRPDAALP